MTAPLSSPSLATNLLCGLPVNQRASVELSNSSLIERPKDPVNPYTLLAEHCPWKTGGAFFSRKQEQGEMRQALTPPPKPLLNPPETQATHSKGASTPPEPEEGSEGSQGQSTGLEAGLQ